MARVIILGSSNAISNEDHENTHLMVIGEERTVLIDCVGNPILRLKQAGVGYDNLTDLILTHFHPDHVSGVPLLLMNMWLLGRKKPLCIYGLPHTMDRIEDLMGLFSWTEWPNLFPVSVFRLPEIELSTVIDCKEFLIVSSPVCHLIPTIGLRVEFKNTNKVAAYSCDTEPCDQVVNLAERADILIHEASGAFPGHTSAEQAGEVARRAKVGGLYLIHYPTDKIQNLDLINEARWNYNGAVKLAMDFMTLDFG